LAKFGGVSFAERRM